MHSSLLANNQPSRKAELFWYQNIDPFPRESALIEISMKVTHRYRRKCTLTLQQPNMHIQCLKQLVASSETTWNDCRSYYKKETGSLRFAMVMKERSNWVLLAQQWKRCHGGHGADGGERNTPTSLKKKQESCFDHLDLFKDKDKQITISLSGLCHHGNSDMCTWLSKASDIQAPLTKSHLHQHRRTTSALWGRRVSSEWRRCTGWELWSHAESKYNTPALDRTPTGRHWVPNNSKYQVVVPQTVFRGRAALISCVSSC